MVVTIHSLSYLEQIGGEAYSLEVWLCQQHLLSRIQLYRTRKLAQSIVRPLFAIAA